MKKRKHILSLGVAICLPLLSPGLLLVSFSANAQTGVTVSVDAPAQIGAGTDFTARVNISQVRRFDACNYDVVFDPSVLELKSVNDGQIDGTTVPIAATNEITAGRVRVVENIPDTPGVNGSDYLANLRFKAITLTASTAIDLQNGTLSNCLGDEITPTTWVSDTVRIIRALVANFLGDPTEAINDSRLYPPTVNFTGTTTGGTLPYTRCWDFGDGVTLTTVETTTSHIYHPPGTKTGQEYTVSLTVTDSVGVSDDEVKEDYITIYQMGDIKVDLTVNALDITKMELIVAGIQDPTFTADANEDGSINSLDITKTELFVATAKD